MSDDNFPTTREALAAVLDHVKRTGTLDGAQAAGLTSLQEHALMVMWDKHRETFASTLETVLAMHDRECWLQGVRFTLVDDAAPDTQH